MEYYILCRKPHIWEHDLKGEGWVEWGENVEKCEKDEKGEKGF